MKLLFFGTQAWSAQFLALLLQENFFTVCAVVTQPDKPVGRKQILSSSPVKTLALAQGLPVLQPTTLSPADVLTTLTSFHPDIAVVIAYGRLIPQKLIEAIPLGCINVHPSLLPKWRGPSPVQAALLAGEAYSGVTMMKIDEQMDHGPVLAQQKISIDETETPDSFLHKVVDIGESFVIQTLLQYAKGLLVPTQQEHASATYCHLLTKKDGQINWNRPAREIVRHIRVFQPWPGTWNWTQMNGKQTRLKIVSSAMTHELTAVFFGSVIVKNTRLFVAANDELVEIMMIQPEGKSPMLASAFLTGYRDWLQESPRFEFVAETPGQTKETRDRSDDLNKAKTDV